VPDASLLRSERQFAAWLGLTPRANSSGGKDRLGGCTKQGDGYLRRLLAVRATAVMRMTRKSPDRQPWMAQLLEQKPGKIATVALANKTERITWAVRSRKELYAATSQISLASSVSHFVGPFYNNKAWRRITGVYH
jgi:transposase